MENRNLNNSYSKQFPDELYSDSNKKNENPWYRAKEFDRFWNVYNNCMFYAHKDALSRCSEVQSDIATTLYRMVKSPLPLSCSFSKGSRSRSRSRKKSRSVRKKKKRRAKRRESRNKKPPSMFVLTDDDTLQVQLQEQMSLEDSQEEVDEEFLSFLETSVKHRIKWNQVKMIKQQQNSQTLEPANYMSDQEHPDVVRGKEMELLYGDSAAKILGMETAMQLSFDRLSTLHQPILYPNIPINLTF